jgi:hypothetical protein
MLDGNCSNEETVWTSAVIAFEMEATMELHIYELLHTPLLVCLHAPVAITGREITSYS